MRHSVADTTSHVLSLQKPSSASCQVAWLARDPPPHPCGGRVSTALPPAPPRPRRVPLLSTVMMGSSVSASKTIFFLLHCRLGKSIVTTRLDTSLASLGRTTASASREADQSIPVRTELKSHFDSRAAFGNHSEATGKYYIIVL